MHKLMGLLLLLVVIGCAHSKSNKKNNENLDGIIFLEEVEAEKPSKSSKSSGKSSNNGSSDQKSDNIEDERNFKEMDGIIFLNFNDQVDEIPEKPLQPNHTRLESGKASYYAMKFSGRKTASGEIYDSNKMTAAHPSLPFGTRVRVTNLYNNTSVVVRINDRGPHVKSRIIDLSYAAAQQLDIISKGIADVAVEVLQ